MSERAKVDTDLLVEIRTDGRARHTTARVQRRRGVEFFTPGRVVQASCSVRTESDGSQIVTATAWIAPPRSPKAAAA